MLARPVVRLTPRKYSHPSQLLSRQQSASASPLSATLMNLLASVANKRLTVTLSPLDATVTRNRGAWLFFPFWNSPRAAIIPRSHNSPSPYPPSPNPNPRLSASSQVTCNEISRRPSLFHSITYKMLSPQPLCFDVHVFFMGGILGGIPSRLSPPAEPREQSARNRVRTHQDFPLLTSLLHYFHLSLLLYFPPVQSLRFHPGEK